MRWWRIARATSLGWLFCLGVWSAIAQPDFALAVIVGLAGFAAIGIAIMPTAPWWRGRTHLSELTPADRSSLVRHDILWIAATLVAIVAAGAALGALGFVRPS